MVLLSKLPGLSEEIYSGETFINAGQGRYKIDTGYPGEPTIVIDDLDTHHAKPYACKDNEQGEQVPAKLPVFSEYIEWEIIC